MSLNKYIFIGSEKNEEIWLYIERDSVLLFLRLLTNLYTYTLYEDPGKTFKFSPFSNSFSFSYGHT